ncbi:MAG: hypothetical protein AABX16_04545 [Nanoarchaeota archaeon]
MKRENKYIVKESRLSSSSQRQAGEILKSLTIKCLLRKLNPYAGHGRYLHRFLKKGIMNSAILNLCVCIDGKGRKKLSRDYRFDRGA